MNLFEFTSVQWPFTRNEDLSVAHIPWVRIYENKDDISPRMRTKSSLNATWRVSKYFPKDEDEVQDGDEDEIQDGGINFPWRRL